MSGELVSEDEKSGSVNDCTGDEEVIMILNSHLQSHQRQHRRRRRNSDLRYRGSPFQPLCRRLDHPIPPYRAILRFIAAGRDRNPTGSSMTLRPSGWCLRSLQAEDDQIRYTHPF
ncbi:hypothetical protein SDJN03_28324, partial [Cucurbita argyrosperma subsp. sororia]